VILDLDAGDARPRYAGFDIAVQASESEGLPNAILEAAAAGLPIVATAVGGTPEVIEDGRTGLLVEPRDPLALAAAIDRLAEDPGARRRLGEAAAVRARDFSPEALAEATVRLYRSLFVPDGAPGSAVPR
jgi:glycosyltransferase involved in cell wall biosynthesis